MRWLWCVVAGCLVMGVTATTRRAGAQNAGDVGFAYGDRRDVRLEGRLVSLQEEMARKYGADIRGGDPVADGQIGLVTPEGGIYPLLQTAASRRLLREERPGAALELQARLFPRSTLIEVLSWRRVEPARLARSFFCSVCTITTQEYGPCACCGREMELVREPR